MKTLTVKELKAIIKEENSCNLIDIRENYEFEDNHIANSKNIPMDDVANNPELIGDNSILICQSGRRAESLCFILEKMHNKSDVKFLTGGILAFDEN